MRTRLALAALVLVLALVGCAPPGGVPAGSQQPEATPTARPDIPYY